MWLYPIVYPLKITCSITNLVLNLFNKIFYTRDPYPFKNNNFLSAGNSLAAHYSNQLNAVCNFTWQPWRLLLCAFSPHRPRRLSIFFNDLTIDGFLGCRSNCVFTMPPRQGKDMSLQPRNPDPRGCQGTCHHSLTLIQSGAEGDPSIIT